MSPIDRTAAFEALAALDDDEREVACLLGLSRVEGVGAKTLLACLRAGVAWEAWRALVADAIVRCEPLAATLRPRAWAGAVRSARSSHPAEELARYREAGFAVLVHGRPGYPARLADDPEPPAVLFSTGALPAPDEPTVAVVGTRNATSLGRTFARRLGAELTRAGVRVVSGLALGIDGSAHRGALDELGRFERQREAGETEAALEPGRPVGVIASGLDIAYPYRHRGLHDEVRTAGLLVSETPLGLRPSEWRFPARNRIIAGLSDAVVVVESRVVGGSMSTVDEALTRSMPVFAVPGHPSSPASAGTNDLLFAGAAIARGADDVLGAIGRPLMGERRRAPTAPEVSGLQQRVLDELGAGPLALAEVVAAAEATVDDVSAALAALEAVGLVVSTGGWYEAAAATPGAGDR